MQTTPHSIKMKGLCPGVLCEFTSTESANHFSVWRRTFVAVIPAISVSLPPSCLAANSSNEKDAGRLKIDEKSDSVLKSLSAYYKSLHTIELEVKAVMTAESVKQRTEVPAEYHVAIERPNKFFVSSKSGRREGLVASDGAKCGYYSSVIDAYMTLPAPQSFSDLFNKPEFLLVTRGWLSMALVESLVSDDPYRDITGQCHENCCRRRR